MKVKCKDCNKESEVTSTIMCPHCKSRWHRNNKYIVLEIKR